MQQITTPNIAIDNMCGNGRRGLTRLQALSEQIADAIVDNISFGHLVPGERLIEARLMEEFDVSRHPVREALQALAAQGVVINEPNRGCRVTAFNENTVCQVSIARFYLEYQALCDVIPRCQHDPVPLQKLDQCIAEMRRMALLDDAAGMADADIAFHRIICQESGNQIAVKLWEGLSRHIRIIRGILGRRVPNLGDLVIQHEELRALIANGELQKAKVEWETHMMQFCAPEFCTKDG